MMLLPISHLTEQPDWFSGWPATLPLPILSPASRAVLGRLQAAQVPVVLVSLCAWIFAADLVDLNAEVLDGVEFFAGGAAVSRAIRAAGMSCISVDVSYHPFRFEQQQRLGRV